MLRVAKYISVFAFALSLVSVPHVAWAETLMGALGRAYDHNSTLNAQRAATRASDEQLPQALSGYRPTVNLTADAGFAGSSTDTFAAGVGSISRGASSNPYGYGISISQNLFTGFRTVNGVKAAKSAIYASRQTLANAEQNTLLNAATAYAAVVFNRELVQLRRRNISFLSEQSRSSQARLDVGEGTRTDVAQSDARLALGRAQLFAAEAQLASAEGQYFQLVGRMPDNLSKPTGPKRLYPNSLQRAMELGASRHPAVLATQHLVDFALFNVKVSEGAFLPTVTLNGSANRRFNTGDNRTDTDSAQATVNLNVPLYQGGRASSVVRQNKQNLSQRRIEVDEARDRVRAEIVTAWTSLQSARANASANNVQVEAANLALRGVTAERDVGQRTQLDVLDAQSQVLLAQELLLQSEQLEVTAGYRLVAGIGSLNSRELGLRVAHYSPQEHFDAVKDKWFGLRTPSGR